MKKFTKMSQELRFFLLFEFSLDSDLFIFKQKYLRFPLKHPKPNKDSKEDLFSSFYFFFIIIIIIIFPSLL